MSSTGRDYFGKLAREYRVESQDPDELTDSPPPTELKRGSSISRVGGRIAKDLKRLEPEETEERRELSEEFLKQPVRHFPED